MRLVQAFLLVVIISIYSSVEPFTDKTWPKTLTVGVINSNDNDRIYVRDATLLEAEKNLKLNSFMPSDLKIKYVYMSPCDDAKSLNAIGTLHEKENVDVIFGPNCGQGITSGGLLASYYNIPITSISVLDSLNDKTKYSTLFRVAFTSTPLGGTIVSLLMYYNWTRIAIVRNHATECDTGLSGIYTFIKKRNIVTQTELYAESISDIKIALKMLKSVARIVLVCFGWDPASAKPFLNEAFTAGMVNSEYVYIVPFYGQTILNSWKPWEANISSDSKVVEMKAYQSTIVVEPASQLSGKIFLNVIENLTNSNLNSQVNLKMYKMLLDNILRNFKEILQLPFLYDSFYLYGLAANKTIENEQDLKDGAKVLNAVKNQQFSGVTGLIMMDSDGDRMPQYYVSSKSSTDQDINPYLTATYDKQTDTFKFEPLSRSPYWGTVDNKPPPDIPVCGFLDENCQRNQNILPIGLPLGLICFVIFVTTVYYFRKKRFEKQIACMVWKIDLSALKFTNHHKTFSSMVSFATQFSMTNNDLKQIKSQHKINKNEKEFSEKIAYYKGRIVLTKCWNKNGPINVSRDLLIYLKQMKDLEHRNLNVFIGAHLETSCPKMVLWAYCSKGNLAEILFQDDIHLDLMFKSSFLRDIVDGLNYLHKCPIGYHGALNVNSCLVNSHWAIRLSDFGNDKIWPYKRTLINNFFDGNYSVQEIYHIDPSYLRLKKDDNMKFLCPKESDIYSLSIVMYQLLFLIEPYSDKTVTSCEIINGILHKKLRPDIPKNVTDSNSKLVELMKLCWNDDVTERPNIIEVKNIIRSSTKQFDKNLLDNVLSMLEKYADNLEKLVEDRTSQLIEERTKTESLLHQLLPRSVAEVLKRGDFVVPESYESVTIYFSDIVSFTSFCSESNPMQIVTFLNHLYSGIDTLLSNFDVYKVETIGDAYMVVSGLPERNGIKHPTEIANMSFAILEFLTTFKVPHIPRKVVQMRIGIHTGPVAAGVVGLKMPRYCLFGDTVNVASRMESNGLPGKIQISESTKMMLDDHGLYTMIYRGQIEIKGKGICTTFWLFPNECHFDPILGKF